MKEIGKQEIHKRFFRIWGSPIGVYEDVDYTGCSVVRVVGWKSTDVSEEHVASIFMVSACFLFHATFLSGLCFVAEDGNDMETSVDFQRTA
jgi:hypothetical protein